MASITVVDQKEIVHAAYLGVFKSSAVFKKFLTGVMFVKCAAMKTKQQAVGELVVVIAVRAVLTSLYSFISNQYFISDKLSTSTTVNFFAECQQYHQGQQDKLSLILHFLE
ncbi:hypothetical protein PoB_002667400 [Plakobranchus ocellatus]|uniref:Uncharacterized protein n=1 Tax=Plakobranchus ocellatus TaxID=259542 RepID=A0AAV3ZXY9_9GAST|nr:hypothetical protein PoB_002667400 [Plakobranchus ocellatus]